MDLTESEVTALLDSQALAMRTKDLDRLMSLYSPDVVYFDTAPPLKYAGWAALRERFSRWFDDWEGSFEMESRDLRVLASGDLAVAHRFSRARGTLRGGKRAESWVRATSCFQRSTHAWLITHEHVSWPVDQKSGNAAKDLTP